MALSVGKEIGRIFSWFCTWLVTTFKGKLSLNYCICNLEKYLRWYVILIALSFPVRFLILILPKGDKIWLLEFIGSFKFPKNMIKFQKLCISFLAFPGNILDIYGYNPLVYLNKILIRISGGSYSSWDKTYDVRKKSTVGTREHKEWRGEQSPE